MVLTEYFDDLALKLNVGKTKVIVFRKKGRLSVDDVWYYKKRRLETVTSYTYLGIPFCSSGLFGEALRVIKKKANNACGAIKEILRRGRTSSLHTACKLFSTMVESVLFYGCETWALRFADEIECVQTCFFRSWLGLGWGCSSTLVRLECGRDRLMTGILRRTLNFMAHVFRMEEDRYPKIILLSLMETFQNNPNDKWNWYGQVKTMVGNCGIREDIFVEDIICDRNYRMSWIEESRNHYRAHDLNKLDSADLAFYKPLFNILQENPEPADYLNEGLGFYDKRLISCIRLRSDVVFWKGRIFKFGVNDLRCCNVGVQDSLIHTVTNCNIQRGNDPIINFLASGGVCVSREEYKLVCDQIVKSLLTRQLLVEELS